MTSLAQLKDEMWVFYSRWRKTGSYCPALKRNVRVSLMGWNHLVGQSGNKKRSTGDVFRRLNLLPHARDVIEMSHTIQNKKKNYFVLEAVVNDIEKSEISVKKVRVIILEDRNKSLIFLSVMGKKI